MKSCQLDHPPDWKSITSAETSWQSNYRCLGQGSGRERIFHFPFLGGRGEGCENRVLLALRNAQNKGVLKDKTALKLELHAIFIILESRMLFHGA